jgi:2-aminoadipate transaminase
MHQMNEDYTNISLEAIFRSSHPRGMPQPTRRPLDLSDRAKTLPGSPIRALLSAARANDQLDLGGGIPDPALFPCCELADVAARVIGEHAAQALQYAPTEGLLPLRDFIAERLARRGCRVTSDRIIVTHGSQQALAALAALLTGPTQAVALEQPVYPGAQQAFMLAQAPVVALPVTEDGWQLEALFCHDVAATYVIANHQNPTGRQATLAQRAALARYAEATGTFVIEDDAYGELGFEGTPARPILADAPTRGILVGTFSKTLCPGLRVGWIVAPSELVEPLLRILQASSLQPGTLAQHLALGLLERLDWQAHLTRLRRVYAGRARALRARCDALGLVSAAPSGGFFLWVQVQRDAVEVAQRARAAGVVLVPELAFRHPNHPGPDRHLRLAFTRFADAASDREKLTRSFSETRRTIPPNSR